MLKYAQNAASWHPFIYDPSQQVARCSGEDLAAGARGARILIVNEYEHDLFCKKTGWTTRASLAWWRP